MVGRAFVILGTVVVSFFTGWNTAHAVPPALQFQGQVVLADGTPAANARLSISPNGQPCSEVRADAAGTFVFSGSFLHNTVIVAQSADRKLQRSLVIAGFDARILTTKPLRIQLRPARQLTVRVMRDGRPVGETHVAVDQGPAPQVTDERGEVLLLLPEGLERPRISAWHPQQGVSGDRISFSGGGGNAPMLELVLQEPAPRRIRVVDEAGKAVPAFRVCPNFKLSDADWFLARSLDKLDATTDTAGQVEFPWAPMRLDSVDAECLRPDWVIDGIVQAPGTGEPAIIQLRRKVETPARLIVPQECSPAGLLLAGSSFGPGERIDLTATRAAADGSVLLSLAPDHCYAVAVCDRQWASDPLTGVFHRTGSKESSSPLELRVYRATPLRIRATIDAENKPLRDTYISIARVVETEWKDSDGNRRHGRHSISHWTKTDDEGRAFSGLGLGTYRISIAHENWRDERNLVVKSEEPISVEFHKPYERQRQIYGQLSQLPQPTADFSGVRVVAVEYGLMGDKTSDIRTDRAGRFVYSTDCQRVGFFAIDASSSVCGAAMAGETTREVAVNLLSTASYEGELVEAGGRPLAGIKLTLSVQAAPAAFVREAETDASGRFHFEQILTELPLQLTANVDGQQRFLARHFFEPGEDRQGIRIRHEGSVERSAFKPPPLRTRLDEVVRDARLANMHVLVVLRGARGQFVESSVLDNDEVPSIVDYMPMIVETDSLQAEDRSFVDQTDWPQPEKGHVVIIALDGASKTLGSAQIQIDAPSAGNQVRMFLEKYRPPNRDANTLWQSALAQAKQTDRRVLLQIGGPRCGPCFSLSRWTDDQQDQLRRDYVVLKLHLGRQQGADEIEAKLRARAGGIPWMAILDSDEKVLTTSDGPLGNIGYPGEFESLRHFRRMLEKTAQRMSADEIESLVATLRR